MDARELIAKWHERARFWLDHANLSSDESIRQCSEARAQAWMQAAEELKSIT